MTSTILVLRAGDAPPPIAARRGEFFDWIRRAGEGAWPGAWREHDLRADAELPDARAFAAIVITGSAASVTERAPWMLRAEAWLRAAAALRVPIFGICFGHQLLAQALGGRVDKNPRGREIGTVALRRREAAKDDPVFAAVGDGLVNMTHVDTVAELPAGATVLATTERDEAAVYRVGEEVWGVQYHPEIDGEVMRGYVEVRGGFIREEGLPYDAILASAADAPAGVGSLRAFLGYVARTRR